MDISDGLALDLSRLCRESGVGATVAEASIPVSDAAREAAAESGRPPVEHALADGEDFELLLALPPGVWEAFARHIAGSMAPAGLAAFTRIGALTAGTELRIVGPGGQIRPLDPKGFQHQW
jgi:thiamine-monophosphate kinase